MGYVISEIWARRWDGEYVDEESWEQRNRDFESWPESIFAIVALALFFGGTITALVVTLLTGWLLSR